jgi:hypothetical protein
LQVEVVKPAVESLRKGQNEHGWLVKKEPPHSRQKLSDAVARIVTGTPTERTSIWRNLDILFIAKEITHVTLCDNLY